MLRRLLGGPEGSDANYLKAPSVESTLPEKCMCTHGRILKYTKCRLWTRRIKITGQRKQKKCSLKVIQITMRTWLWDSESIHVSTYFSFFFLINTCFTIFHLCGNTFPAKPKSQGLVIDLWSSGWIWCSHHCDPTSTSDQKLKPTSSLCRLSHPRSRSYSICLSMTYFIYITLSNIHVAVSGTKSFSFMAE